jgi:hypothetical protein
MSNPRKQEAAQTHSSFQFTLAGLIIFSLALIGGAALITCQLGASSRPPQANSFTLDLKDKASTAHVGPWGELVTHDISLERPVEYLTEEVTQPPPEIWTFKDLKPEAVKTLLQHNGLSAPQIATLFTAGGCTENNSGTALRPTTDFLLSLPPETRHQLFTGLAGRGVNLYIDYPYIFPAGSLEDIYQDARLHPDDVESLKHFIYANGSAQQLSDYQALLNQIPTVERRVALTSALSRQSAVLARLLIRPDTDIDKIASYWSNVPNVRFTDIRPLLTSLKQLPEGGTISLLYLLPKFARERLYTFPLPPQAGEPTMDCHWTTFNFSSETPDNRFNDPSYTVRYIQKNYYPIAAPSQYGDVVLLMNDKNAVKHSAVYVADNIVFTKNGNNYRQPWMLMRIPDLLTTYPSTPSLHPVYMRHRAE